MTIGAASRAPGRESPTYIFPEEVRWVIRARFPDDPIHLYDGRLDSQASAYRVDVVDLATTTWPSCRCQQGSRAESSGTGGPVRRGRSGQRASGTPYHRGQ
ncbi:hypothetical protein Bbelb_282720 [Branchiostoma belcheri]|nr:hypothetical protein Bbelb_282720 [Branchiostoma belcheri]